jgi:DNA-binding transcriptional ArsR family regulator
VNPSGISSTAALIADDARSAMLVALARGDRLAAKDLAAFAGVSSSTASSHLGKLVDGRLVSRERAGRIHYYRLAGPAVARTLESLSALRPGGEKDGGGRPHDDRRARTCYDHLAGRLGVSLMEALAKGKLISRQGWSRRPARGGAVGTTKAGIEFLRSFGVSPPAVRAQQRSYAHQCLDRTEGRPHLAGALGAAITARIFELHWLERLPDTRALRITAAGRRGFKAQFGIES